MKVIHCGTTYECAYAVKCENDNYIKLYNENGAEIAAFHNISDFADYELIGGTFVDPCSCRMPLALSVYSIGGRTISTDDWILGEDNRYYYEIESALISGNVTTCNISIFFAQGTELDYEATQEAGKLTLYTKAAPLSAIVIDSLQVTRI